MRDILPISLDSLQQEHLRELFELLGQAFGELNVDYYVLGALARDAWFATERKQTRTTRDVDFAVYVNAGKEYEDILKHLVDQYDFKRVENAPVRLRTPFGYTVDIVPFGIESIDGKVELEEGTNRPIYINGLEEVFEHAAVLAQENETELEFKIASLPGILLLKLIAYDDRSEMRTKDPRDIRDIILNYFDIEGTKIYEYHNDLFGEDLELHEISAVVIGRHIKHILSSNRRLRERLMVILSAEHRTQQRMIENMADMEISEEQVKRWLSLILKGIKV